MGPLRCPGFHITLIVPFSFSLIRFPFVLRRSEITSADVLELSPIENAVISMRNKNKELQTFLVKYGENRTQNCNPFTMALNGVVDAPVNGGVAMYRTSFFSDAYVAENPQHRGLVKELQAEIDTQVQVVERCIALHGEIVPENMLPLHSKIIENFDKNFKDEIARLLPTRLVKKPLIAVPETPIHPSLAAQLSQSSSGNLLQSTSTGSSLNLLASVNQQPMVMSPTQNGPSVPAPSPVARSHSSGSLHSSSENLADLDLPRSPPPVALPRNLPPPMTPPANLPPPVLPPSNLPPPMMTPPPNLPPPVAARPGGGVGFPQPMATRPPMPGAIPMLPPGGLPPPKFPRKQDE